jgi:hypothetical protein
MAGEVFWYAVGCFYAWEDGSLQDFGYFARLGDVPEPLFRGAPGPGSAFFTFAADPFRAVSLPPTDPADTFAASIDPPGRFRIFFNAEPCSDFTHPESFARGLAIATFERVGAVVGASTPQGTSNLFTARLVASTPFEIRGQRFDLREMLGRGVTQMGAGGAPFQPSAARARLARSFVGTAVRLD